MDLMEQAGREFYKAGVPLEQAKQYRDVIATQIDQFRNQNVPPSEAMRRLESMTFEHQDATGKRIKIMPFAPVLKEQPTMLESLTSPGGLASPQNLGMITGGSLGAIKGAAIGAAGGPVSPLTVPLGAALGGLLGAGAGAMGGRGYEMALEKVFGPFKQAGTLPPPPPAERSATDVVSELGTAANEGMFGQAVGAGTGALIGKVGGKLLAPMAAKFTPEAQRAASIAKDAGIDITPGQVIESGALSRLQGFAGRGIAGADRSQAFVAKQARQSAQAVYDLADSLSPGLSQDVRTVEAFTKAAANSRLSGMQSMANKLVSQVSGGQTVSLRQAGEIAQKAKGELFEVAKASGDKMYAAVKTAAGPAANSIESPNFLSSVNKIVAKEAEMYGVELPSARVARGAARQLNPKPPTMEVGDKIRAAQAAYFEEDLPQQLIDRYGLGKQKAWTFDALRDWQSRLGYLSQTASTPKARADFAQMFAAVSDDIQAWGEKLPGNVNGLLKTANEFWRTKVADTYYNRLIARMDKADPDTIAGLIFSPRASADSLNRVKTAIGADAYGKAAGAYLDNLMSHATDSGVFNPNKVLQIFNNHDPETLKAIFGKNIDGQRLVAKLFQRNPTNLINAVSSKEGVGLLDYVVPKGGNIEGIDELRRLLPKEQFNQFSGAFMKNVVDKSTGNTGEFSIERFLTQVNGPNGYKPAQMRHLLGDQYGHFRELTDLFSRMAKSNEFYSNRSGTGQAILSSFQAGATAALAIDVAGQILTGNETPSRAITQFGAGLAIISPSLVAKAIYSPNGIKWLTQGLKAPAGSKAGVAAIEGLTKAVAANTMKNDDAPEPPAPQVPPPLPKVYPWQKTQSQPIISQ